MNTRIQQDAGIVARLELFSRLSGMAAIAAGGIAFMGWWLDIARWRSLLTGHMEIPAYVALVFILAGSALLFSQSTAVDRAARNARQACAIAVTAIGVFMLCQYLLGWYAGTDPLFFGLQSGAVATAFPARLTLPECLSMCLLGAALLLIGVESRSGVSVSHLLVIPVVLISLVTVNQYLYGSESVRVGMPEALTVLVLSAGILSARPHGEPMATLTSAGNGGYVLRRQFPAVIALLVAGVWLRIAGETAGLYDSAFGTSFNVMMIGAGTGAVLWWSARSLDRTDAARLQAKQQLRTLNAELEQRVAQRTAQLEAANQELRNEIAGHELAKAALQNHAGRLRILSQQLINVQETERSRIARELHDQIGQTLTAAKLGMQIALTSVTDKAIAARLEDSVQLAAQVVDQVRSLSLDLRPPLLDELGLVAALDSHVTSQAGRSGLIAQFDADRLPADLSPEIAIACFRVTQEALNNVVRHARASRVTIELRLLDDVLRLQVTDDGTGFDPEVTRRRALTGKSIGLLSMAERAMLIDGKCEIISAPGSGTSVRATFPLEAALTELRNGGAT